MNNMTAFGQSALQEAQIWGSALETGFNYGANIIIPPGTPVYQGLDWLNRNIADPFYNTLTQPGYNYGQWLYGERNFRNFFGASLDSAWALTGISGAIKAVAVNGPPYWQYSPANNPGYKSPWLTRGWQPPYATGAEASRALNLPSYNPGTTVRDISVSWWEIIAGPRKVTGGTGWEYFRGSFLFPK